MKKRNLFCACILVVILLLLSGCGCQHEWEEATCRTAKTCIHCGKTEGEPLRHDWQEATCTSPKTCARCEKTKGEPLGHVPGEVVETVDVVKAERHCEQCCQTCGAVLSQSSEYVDSFLTDADTFVFSPNQFLNRLSNIAKEYYPDFTYSVTETISGAIVQLDWGIDEDYTTTLIFHHADYSAFTQAEYNTAGVYCVAFGCYGTLESTPTYLDQDMFFVIGQAVDPLFTSADLQLMLIMKLASLANTVEFGEPWGCWDNRQMLYQFSHNTFSADTGAMGYEGTLIYAVESLDEY